MKFFSRKMLSIIYPIYFQHYLKNNFLFLKICIFFQILIRWKKKFYIQYFFNKFDFKMIFNKIKIIFNF